MLVITGASGLLGASVLLHARDLGQAAVGLCHRKALNIPGFAIHTTDLTDHRAARAVLTSLQPTHIVHCAAATNVDWCEDHPNEASAINSEAPAFLARLAQELKSHFVYISTDAVFDGKQGNYSETDTPAPVNVYGETKLHGEQQVLQGSPLPLAIRVNIYGWNAQPKLSLAEWILSRLDSGKTVPGFTDVHFTPLLVNDLAELLLAMLDRGLSGLYHVVGSERVSKFEFARRVALVFGFDPEQVIPAQVAKAGLRAARPSDLSLSTRKISGALDRSMPDVESGLRRFRALRDAGYPQQLKGYMTGAQQ